jgi:hypothetical protein
MSADVAAWILAAVMVLSVGLLLRFALRSARAHEARHQEAMALYRRGLDLSQTGQELQTESNSLMRELIAELRASRQAPGTPPASEKLSN